MSIQPDRTPEQQQEPVRVCANCGREFTRRNNPGKQPEAWVRFHKRRHCSHECSRGNLPGWTLEQRFLSKVDAASSPTGCWMWTAYISTQGYGIFSRGNLDQLYAHRWSYENYVGPIPDGLEIDHLCRVRACCNPSHLEAVTHAENVKRGTAGASSTRRSEAMTGCSKGHPLERYYTYYSPTLGRNVRRCRDCRNSLLRNKGARV